MLFRSAEKLLEKEVIFKEDLETIFGKRPFDKEEEVSAVIIAEKPSLNGTANIEEPKSEEPNTPESKEEKPSEIAPEAPKTTLF